MNRKSFSTTLSKKRTPRANPLYKDGKGLISSSSSSLPSPPPPRPYRFVTKPLSEDLRSRIIEFFGRCSDGDDIDRSDDICQLTEIEDCADPCDPESVKDYMERTNHYWRWPMSRRYFTPNQIPHTSGEKIYGNPVFELYSIEIKKLDPMRDFYSINMTGTNTDYHPVIIYNRNWPEYDEEMEITLNQPLPLKNIFRLPSALDNVTINLSNPSCGGWIFCHSCNFPDDMKYKMYQKDFKDEVTDSVASISYELIESAAVAELQFTFLDENERPIRILSGSISATTDGKQSTKRLIRQFPKCTLQSNELVSVNRSVFGVSKGSRLHVELELYYDYDDDDEPKWPSYIKKTLHFKAPEKTHSVDKDIYIRRRRGNYMAKMKVKVSWWDEIP